jgi:hypothetical protein
MRTMLRLLVALAIAVTATCAAPAQAQKKGVKPAPRGTKTKFYNFDDMVVDGEFRKPSVLLTTAREQARFERLLRLRKSFLPEMFKTARFPVLKALVK